MFAILFWVGLAGAAPITEPAFYEGNYVVLQGDSARRLYGRLDGQKETRTQEPGWRVSGRHGKHYSCYRQTQPEEETRCVIPTK